MNQGGFRTRKPEESQNQEPSSETDKRKKQQKRLWVNQLSQNTEEVFANPEGSQNQESLSEAEETFSKNEKKTGIKWKELAISDETDENQKQQKRLEETKKTLFHDFKTLETNPIDGVIVATSETAIMTWNVNILSPDGFVEILVRFFLHFVTNFAKSNIKEFV